MVFFHIHLEVHYEDANAVWLLCLGLLTYFVMQPAFNGRSPGKPHLADFLFALIPQEQHLSW